MKDDDCYRILGGTPPPLISRPTNPNFKYHSDRIYSSTAELGVGIICACLPAFNIFFTAAERSSKARYVEKSMKLSNLSGLTSSKPKGKNDGLGGSTVRDSYVEIGTPQDIGALITPPEGAMKRGSWPLRTSGRAESYFELRPGIDV